MSKIPHRLYLTGNWIPQKWFNLRSATAGQPDPLLHSGTLRPLGVDDLSSIFCEELTRQELNGATTCVDIPEPVQNVYKMYRSSLLIRAYEPEKTLDTPVRIYHKFKGDNTSGSYKLNSAVAQAYHAKMQGLAGVTTETRADQWGTVLSEACSYFGLTCDVFMIKCPYGQKPFQKAVMSVFGASITPSPPPAAEVGRQIPRDHPDTTGSLGCAISKAVGPAVQNGGAKRYVLGSMLNQVLLRQSITGLENKLAMEQLGGYPDMMAGCTGGGSSLGGLTAPFMADKLRGMRNPRIVAVESASCPSLARGKYVYDFCNAGRIIPLARIYTLGCGFVSSVNHVGGLRYHGTSPTLSKLYHDGYMEAVAYEQTRAFEAAMLSAEWETTLPALESAHTTRGAIDKALRCRESRGVKAIPFGLIGIGYFDMTTYKNCLSGKMSGSTPTGADLQEGFDSLSKIPQSEGI